MALKVLCYIFRHNTSTEKTEMSYQYHIMHTSAWWRATEIESIW